MDLNILYLYSSEIGAALEKLESETQEWKLLGLLAGSLETHYKGTVAKLIPMIREGKIEFECLWALFKPGTIVVTRAHPSDEELQCFMVDYTEKYEDERVEKAHKTQYIVEGHFLDFDGKQFRHKDIKVAINVFKGTREIKKLAVCPLDHYDNCKELTSRLLDRGKRFRSLSVNDIFAYEKTAIIEDNQTITVSGRFIVDPEGYETFNTDYSRFVRAASGLELSD